MLTWLKPVALIPLSGRSLTRTDSRVKDRLVGDSITYGYAVGAFDHMNLRQLQYCVTVAETESFTKAARQLHVSQPGLSQQIRALEAELGGPLIERLTQGIRLTPAGR